MLTRFLMILGFLLLVGQSAFALDQAKPPSLPPNHPSMESAAPAEQAEDNAAAKALMAQDRRDFQAKIQLDRLRLLPVQHRDQIKILDSWARQSLRTITHRQSWEGQDPLYTALDMGFRPEVWQRTNIIYVRDVPIREQLAQLAPDDAERQRIMTKAFVSPALLTQPAAQNLLQRISQDAILERAANNIFNAEETFDTMFHTLTIVPPAAPTRHQPWHHPAELAGDVPELASQALNSGKLMPPLPGYSVETATKILLALRELHVGWRFNNVDQANQGIAGLVAALEQINPAEARSNFTHELELWYNRTFNGTIVAFVYCTAMVFFMIAAVGGAPGARRPAIGFFVLAVACHVLAMGTRWYLAGRIPNQNQFESVLGAALFGCLVGLALELWRKNNLFGMAMSFVGFLAMIACFVFPFVVGTEMGANIGTVAGILSNNIWLYIHVNIVIASYSLIGASFVLGATYLGVHLWHWMNPLVSMAAVPALAGASGGTITLGAGGNNSPEEVAELSRRRVILERIDGANVVVLQLAFWMLGVGIVCGAIWADVSWGRPWGWDPKETFALVTWIVYLIIIHVRFVTPRNRALVTSILAIVGFAIMMFNWIGVNFWLVGLHSYA